jgi:beta-lactamase regulating signal transducer with metallopeptidase domain
MMILDLAGTLSEAFVRLTIDVSVKAIILLVIVGVALKLLRGLSASTHATILTWVAISLALLPLLSAVGPAWNMSLLPNFNASPASAVERGLGGRATPDEGAVSGAGDADVKGEVSAGYPRWPQWALLAWAVGMTAYLAWLLVGRLGLWWIHRHSRPLQDERWASLTEEVADEMGLRIRVPLYISEMVHMAVTTGALSPRVILPPRAQDWPDERRKVVLIHELAHIRRRDSLIEVTARAATAIHWFNPLVWLAMRQLRIERERACDNAVLHSGAKPSDYATQLMEAAAELGAFQRPLWQTAATSEGSSLKDRLLCILDPDLRRGPAPVYSPILTALMTIVLVSPLAAVSVWTGNRDNSLVRAETTGTAREAGRAEQTPSPRPSATRQTRAQEKAKASPAPPEASAVRTDATLAKRAATPSPIPAGIPRQSRIARLTRDLHSPDWQVRITAAVALKEMRSPETIPALLGALDDSYEEVRITAVVALGALDDPRTIEGLSRALDDPAERIRVQAVAELGKRRTRAAYDALLEASRHSSWFVRDAARAELDKLEQCPESE